MKHNVLLILFISWLASPVLGQSTAQNYICTIVPHVKTADASSLSSSEASISIRYFDGLGRPTQSVSKGVTPSSKDLVSIVEYDAAGRQTHEWLPVAASGTPGSYRSPEEVKAQSSSFYGGDEYAYTRTSYDYSPLNRVLKKLGPGEAWHLNDQAQCLGYFTNADTGDLSVPYISIEGNKLRWNGVYSTGSLAVQAVQKEGSITHYEFIDMQGKRIKYKNVQYIYDDLGQLRYVLHKQTFTSSVNSFKEGLNETTPSSEVYKFGYAYTYDKRGNCITRKLPGIEPDYYVYDSADRPVLSQTPNQRLRDEWGFIKYDVFSRPVMTGTTIIRDKSHNELREAYSHLLSREEPQSTNNNCFGYTNQTPPKENLVVLKVDYYDNYNFKAVLNLGTDADYAARNGFPFSWHSSPKGLRTGSVVNTLSATGNAKSLSTVYYYDRKTRLIQQRGNNLIGGCDNYYMYYNFSGKATDGLHEHSSVYVASLKERYGYVYDAAGRLVRCTHSLNDGVGRTIISNVYDELSRISDKTLPQNMDRVVYGYNTRGMLTGIQSACYQQDIHYGHWPADRKNKSFDGTPSGTSYHTIYKDPDTNELKQTEKMNLMYKFGDDRNSGSVYSLNMEGDASKVDYKYTESIGSEGRGIYNRDYKGIGVDRLYMTSDGFRLSCAFDDSQTAPSVLPVQYASKLFTPNPNPNLFYDSNGNFCKDVNRGVVSIDYNLLNLPDGIHFENGSNIRYTYDADGVKRRADYKTVFNEVLTPIGIPAPGAYGTLAVENHTDYCDNLIYEDNVLKKIRFEGGYINYDSSTKKGEYCYYIQDQIGNNRVVLSESRGVVQYADYYPYGIPFAEIPIEEDNFLHAGKELEKMHGLYWYDNGKRWYDPLLARFTTMDPLCEKYYDKNPYAYCGDNPLKYGDVNGDSISLFNMQELDNTLGTNYTQQLVSNLQLQTGLVITANSESRMSYAKDNKGNPIITTTTNTSGNTTQVGSKTARTLMINAMDHQDMVTVVTAGKSGVPPGTNELRIGINQITKFINGTNGLNNKTLGFGMTLIHELHHTQVGGGLRDSPGNPGPVVTQMNVIRSELNSNGENYGQRLDYSATSIGGKSYIPFDNTAKGQISALGLPPLLVNKYIKF